MSYFGGLEAAMPAGFFPCDGRELDRTLYPELFAYLGTKYGSTIPTGFKIPWVRETIRVVDSGGGRDPDGQRPAGGRQQGRTASPNTPFTGVANSGGNHTHANVNTSNAGSHHHWMAASEDEGSSTLPEDDKGTQNPVLSSNNGSHSHTMNYGGANHTHTASINGGGDPETRPRVQYVNFMIRAI